MANFVDGPEIPLGLGMALAQNLEAMNRFATMPLSQQRIIIEGTHTIQSKQEMQDYVQSLLR